MNRLRDVIRQRQAAFAELAQTDPAQALALLLPEASLAPLRSLDVEIASGLESEGDWTGPVEVVAEDDFEHHTSKLHLSLEVGNEQLPLFSSAPPELRTGDTVATAGVRMGRLLLARRISLTARVGAAASASTTTGTQHLAILLVNFRILQHQYLGDQQCLHGSHRYRRPAQSHFVLERSLVRSDLRRRGRFRPLQSEHRLRQLRL